MNSIVNMVNYYLIHKNADDSVVEYIKNKIDNTKIEDLIIIQIELLYTDPSDKLVSSLVYYINNYINNILKNISINDLSNLTSLLKIKVLNINDEIYKLKDKNNKIFQKIKTKDLNLDQKFDEIDTKIASDLINEMNNNEYIINRKNSEINSINIWLINLDNSLNKKIDNASLEELLNCYIKELGVINRDEFINSYISSLSNKIESLLFNTNLLDMITNIMPELNNLYNKNSNERNELYKLLDYYIDIVDSNIKKKINNLEYEEKIILKEKIKIISYEILNNDTSLDDFKVLVINSYLKYL